MTNRKGLEGVVAAQTSISDIDGQKGKLYYAGYDIADLAAHATFEETVYLLHHRELPTRQQLEDTAAALRGSSALDEFLVGLISSIAGRTVPMTVLRTAISAAAALDPDDDSPEANLRKAYRLMAKTPQVVATYQRLRSGRQAVPAREDLGVAANFLYALTGTEPDPGVARDFDVVLVLYADHTMNAHLRRQGGGGHPCRHVRRRHRRAGHPAGPAARRGDRAGAPHARRDRRRRPGGRVGQGAARPQAEGHGLRPSRLPDLGPAGDDPAGHGGAAGQAGRRDPLVRHLRADPGDRDGGEGPVPQRGLLHRQRILGPRHPARPVHLPVRQLADGRLDRPRPRAVRRQPPHPPRLRVHRPGAPRLAAAGRQGLRGFRPAAGAGRRPG